MKIVVAPANRNTWNKREIFDDELKESRMKRLPNGSVSIAFKAPGVGNRLAQNKYTVMLTEDDIRLLGHKGI